MIYHVLPEAEPLSARNGGALAHTVANLMKLDPSRVAVCPESDDSWGFDSSRIITVPELKVFGRLRARRFYPLAVAGAILRWMFRDFIACLKPGDVVWCHNRPVFAAALAKLVHAKGAKLVCHFHDGIDPRSARRAFSTFAADAVIFVSDYLRRYWLAQLPQLESVYTAHNGAAEERFFPRRDPVENAIPVIVFAGRLHAQKGAHVLIEAMKILGDRHIPAYCKIIGSAFSGNSGPTQYVNDIKSSAPANVQFEGHCPATKMGDQFRSGDIFCCPSIWEEPFGKVIVEAMACGLPVVATRVGGIPEIARDGGVLLVKPGSATELADALQSLIKDLNKRQAVAEAGLASFHRNFTWHAVLSRYNEIINGLKVPYFRKVA